MGFKKLAIKKMGLIFSILFLTIVLLGVFVYTIIHSKNDYIPTKYERELIEYFKEVALNSEFDDSPLKTIKWKRPMYLFIYKDKEYVHQIKVIKKTVNKINELAEDGFKIELTDDKLKSNTILYLCGKDKAVGLDSILFEGIDEDFAGLAYVESDWEDYRITNAKIFIDIEESLEVQESTILEEMTQSIGLMNDSERYSNSIFYQHQIEDNIINNEYSKMDKDIIRLLYHPKMKPGLNSKQCEKVIKKILKNRN